MKLRIQFASLMAAMAAMHMVAGQDTVTVDCTAGTACVDCLATTGCHWDTATTATGVCEPACATANIFHQDTNEDGNCFTTTATNPDAGSDLTPDSICAILNPEITSVAPRPTDEGVTTVGTNASVAPRPTPSPDTPEGVEGIGLGNGDSQCTQINNANATCTACLDVSSGGGGCAWRSGGSDGVGSCTSACFISETRENCVSKDAFPAAFSTQQICDYKPQLCVIAATVTMATNDDNATTTTDNSSSTPMLRQATTETTTPTANMTTAMDNATMMTDNATAATMMPTPNNMTNASMANNMTEDGPVMSETNMTDAPAMEGADNNATTMEPTTVVGGSGTTPSEQPADPSVCMMCLDNGCSHSQTFQDGASMCLQACTDADDATECFNVPNDNATSADICQMMLDVLPIAPAEATIPPADVVVTAAPTMAPTQPVPCTTGGEECVEIEGTFCSSSTSTCIAANCTNWLAGTPAGQPFYSELACPEIVTGNAKREFCGFDGMCREYGCENWYKWGPVAYTGYDPTSPVELECGDYTDGEEDNANSIVQGCRTYRPGVKVPEGTAWPKFFDIKCTAKPRGGHEFECFSNKPGEYTEFQGDVARIGLPSCDRTIYEVLGIEQPEAWYNLLMRQDRKGTETYHLDGRENTTSSSSFNALEADQSMFSSVTSEDPAPEQQFGTPAPVEPKKDSGAATMMVGTLSSALLFCLVVLFQ